MLRISSYSLASILLLLLVILQPYYVNSDKADGEEIVVEEGTTTEESLDVIDDVVDEVGSMADEYLIYLIIAANIAVAGFFVKCLIWLIKYINNSGSTLMCTSGTRKSTTAASVTENGNQTQVEELSKADGGMNMDIFSMLDPGRIAGIFTSKVRGRV
ncbi:hypothetical protein Y032_0232g3036 [Ancylostoma ceylanicum]|nr:hypothetical protein Y032_0232g3036 [Ancylostoma ceylanicum]